MNHRSVTPSPRAIDRLNLIISTRRIGITMFGVNEACSNRCSNRNASCRSLGVLGRRRLSPAPALSGLPHNEPWE
jgi:hypothetical protein